jgi:hypothetical protein
MRGFVIILETKEVLEDFYDAISALNDCDYDLEELVSDAVRVNKQAIDGNIDDELCNFLDDYCRICMGKESGQQDWPILQDALIKLCKGINYHLEINGMFNEVHDFEFEMIQFRNDRIFMMHRDDVVEYNRRKKVHPKNHLANLLGPE